MRGFIFASVMLGLGASAHADVVTQAHDIFSNQCARCHAAEKLRPATSTHAEPARVTKHVNGHVVETPGVDPLRQWMETSHENDPDTHCRANQLDAVQREIVLAYLRKKVDPRARPWTQQKLTAIQNGGKASPFPERKRKPQGQGDHR